MGRGIFATRFYRLPCSREVGPGLGGVPNNYYNLPEWGNYAGGSYPDSQR
jgi:hypothetical protein